MAERDADRVTHSQLLKTMKWSDIDFKMAKSSYGFPGPVGYTLSGAVNVQREATYSRAKIAAWREEFLGFAAKVK